MSKSKGTARMAVDIHSKKSAVKIGLTKNRIKMKLKLELTQSKINGENTRLVRMKQGASFLCG